VDRPGDLLAGALDGLDLDPVADLFYVHAGLRRSGCCFAEVVIPLPTGDMNALFELEAKRKNRFGRRETR
jgi:hypothetical protein